MAADSPGKYDVTWFSAGNGVEDGLVNDILQDRKGLLWFATWNGLYRFDGYNFKNYKSSAEDPEGLTNDRLLSVDEDPFACLWILCYDSSACRFNPGKEVFEPVRGGMSNNFQSISVLPNGSVWLMQSGGNALRARTDPEDLSLSFESYGPATTTVDGSRKTGADRFSGHILSIFAASDSAEWILADNGLYCLRDSTLSTVAGGSAAEAGALPDAFYSAAEHGDGRLLFGAARGQVYVMSGAEMHRLQLGTSAPVISILHTPDGIVYITDTDGFFIDNRDSGGGIKHITLESLTQLEDKTIISAQIAGRGLVWLTHEVPGVTLFDMQTQKLTYFAGKDESGRPLDTETGFFALENSDGILWIHPKGGGFSFYDAEKKQLVPFNTTEQSVKWKSNDRCYTAFSDRQGNLWMSTQLDRLKRITFMNDRFHVYTPNPGDMDLPDNEIRALYIDRKGRIWTGSRDRNISVYDSGFALQARFHAGRVYAITQETDDVFWISTKGDGLIKAIETAGNHYRLSTFANVPGDEYSLSSNNVYCLFRDDHARLWIATYGGGLNLMERLPDGSVRFINSANRLKNYPSEQFNKVRHITQDREGRIWVSTTAGIIFFDASFREPEDIVFHTITRGQDAPNGLSNNDVHMITCADDGRICAITYGGGLNELLPDRHGNFLIKPFTQEDGLLSDIIYSIQEDSRGRLWLATGGGPVRFISDREHRHYPGERITFNMHFSEGAGAFYHGNIYFGTNRGILYFQPENIDRNDYISRIFFSSIWVDNEELTPKKTPSLLSTSLDDVRHIVLPSNNHSLRLVFSALDMTDTEYIKYAYMLDGFDKEYRYTDGGHEANYTNLPPGKYLFHVKSTNDEGVWLDNEKILSFEVLPSFSETLYADLFIVLLILAVILSSVYIYTVFYRMKQKIKNEELIAQLKLNFFTDVSHELRTPLTLISGPLEFIIRNGTLPDDIRKSLTVIKKNSDRMQRLVGQILDFSKIHENKMRLRVQYKEITGFTADIVQSFLPLAREKKINLVFDAGHRACHLWFDADKIEKVIFNLLSNAFKYTPNGKSIHVFIEEDDDAAVIKITDQGIGIPKDRQNRLFTRFDNLIQQQDVHSSSMSTGIGLSLVKKLVELHHGSITVESAAGKGSIFSFRLRKGKAHYPPDVEYILDDLPEYHEMPSDDDPIPEQPDMDTPLMLIVEDNDDLRSFIKQVFRDKFRVVEADNGNDGLKKACSFMPDIIITDIMMPEKDGLQMLKELKDDERTSHIPAIVLTARSNIESVLSGIRTGADDYIVKPFSVSYLQAKIENILAQRKKMQAYYASKRPANNGVAEDGAGENPEIPGLSAKDEAFLAKLSGIMEQNMDNAALSIDSVISNFSLGRTNFFNKLKSLTGLSPVAYIIDARMRKAAELIKEGQYTMSEIAYMVGYNDPHYFSKSFKSYWGMTCTRYARSQT
jgi:signal transduction histidine kinase/CheY-like chemotaxis protein/ligand-binding sensor domain-containing protein/AraC-like DNA-binding protein